MLKLIIKLLLLFSVSMSIAYANNPSPIDPNRELPTIFRHSYVGMSMGWMDAPFTNENLENNLVATSTEQPHAAPRIFLGHFFNPYFALQLSLMRPINWMHYHGILTPDQSGTVWQSLFGITARPTLPLSNKFSLYGDLGLGLISRHGFTVNGLTAVSSEVIPNLLTGGGITYAFTPRWHYDLGVSYTPAKNSVKQPRIVYAYTGFYYLMLPSKEQHEQSRHPRYYFPLNFIQAGFFTDELFHANANKYVSEGGLPIFWGGKIKNRNAVYVIYERNFFHTQRSFSLEWGVSAARYQSQQLGQTYYTFSLLPALKLWLIRGRTVDFYFTYSIGAPTYITRHVIDGIDSGQNFTFQDLLGFGFFLGREKRFNVNVKIGHYSNGNLFPLNCGIAVPLTIAAGFTF